MGRRNLRNGFTLIEILIFMAIFSLVIISFVGVLISVTRVQVRQLATVEVQSQSQFLLQTIQRYISAASLVEMTADSAQSTLTLRMKDAAQDPTLIQSSGGAVQLKQGSGAWQDLTSSNVSVSNLSFTRRNNFPGHDSVAVSFVVAYAGDKSANPLWQFSQTLNISVARVTAATFNANVIPGAGGVAVGTAAAPWHSINDIVYFSGSNVGIGDSAPPSALTISGGNLYLETADRGLYFYMAGDSSCDFLSILDSGAFGITKGGVCP